MSEITPEIEALRGAILRALSRAFAETITTLATEMVEHGTNDAIVGANCKGTVLPNMTIVLAMGDKATAAHRRAMQIVRANEGEHNAGFSTKGEF